MRNCAGLPSQAQHPSRYMSLVASHFETEKMDQDVVITRIANSFVSARCAMTGHWLATSYQQPPSWKQNRTQVLFAYGEVCESELPMRL